MGRWDGPTEMATVKKLDAKRRAVFPDRFSPGDVFVEEVEGDRIVYRLIEPEEVSLAEVVEEGGRHFVRAPLNREAIARAVRQERDTR